MPADLPGVVTTLDAGLLRVTTLDPPARMNAVRIETLDAVTDAFEWCAGDSAVRAAVLTGAGGAFCTGADQSTTTTNDRPTAATIDAATIDAANRTVAVIRAFPVLSSMQSTDPPRVSAYPWHSHATSLSLRSPATSFLRSPRSVSCRTAERPPSSPRRSAAPVP